MLRSRRSALPMAICAALAGPASAGVPFDQLIGFGVSFEDVGQFPDIDFVGEFLPGLVTPPGAGLDGSTGFRVTNIDPATGERGRAWIETFSNAIGTGELVPSTPLLYPGDRTDIPDTQNINFAYAAARAEQVLNAVIAESVVRHPISSTVGQELTETSPGFLQRVEAGDLAFSENTLFVVNSGGNDVRDAEVDDPTALPLAGAEITLEAIKALVDAGAQTIVVPTLPPVGLFSESTNFDADGSRSDKARARNIGAAAFNSAMAEGLADTGGNIVVVDFGELFLEVLANPGAFGFSTDFDQSLFCYSDSDWSMSGINCTEPEGRGKSSGGNPDDFMANDGLHPTQAMAQILADYAESVLRAPGLAALLPEQALGDARAFRNTVQDYQVRRRWLALPEGIDVFATLQGEDTDIDDSFSTPAASADGGDVTVGFSTGFSEHWFVGGAIGSGRSELDLDELEGGFDSTALMGSLFAGYREDAWFFDLAFTAGRSDLEDIRRTVRLGSTRVYQERAKTAARTIGVASELGANLMPDDSRLRLGPWLGLDYLQVKVDGYSERGRSVHNHDLR